jgi:hypothetical protein
MRRFNNESSWSRSSEVPVFVVIGGAMMSVYSCNFFLAGVMYREAIGEEWKFVVNWVRAAQENRKSGEGRIERGECEGKKKRMQMMKTKPRRCPGIWTPEEKV